MKFYREILSPQLKWPFLKNGIFFENESFFLERFQKLMLISVNYKNQMADQNNMNMEHEQFDYDFDTLSMVSDDSGYYTIPFLPFNPVLPGV